MRRTKQFFQLCAGHKRMRSIYFRVSIRYAWIRHQILLFSTELCSLGLLRPVLEGWQQAQFDSYIRRWGKPSFSIYLGRPTSEQAIQIQFSEVNSKEFACSNCWCPGGMQKDASDHSWHCTWNRRVPRHWFWRFKTLSSTSLSNYDDKRAQSKSSCYMVKQIPGQYTNWFDRHTWPLFARYKLHLNIAIILL